jgi:hypothetical protein
MWEVRVIGNFPEKAVRIGEVSGVPLEFRPCPAPLHEASSASLDLGQELVDLTS